jgi:hypothetical protein
VTKGKESECCKNKRPAPGFRMSFMLIPKREPEFQIFLVSLFISGTSTAGQKRDFTLFSTTLG